MNTGIEIRQDLIADAVLARPGGPNVWRGFFREIEAPFAGHSNCCRTCADQRARVSASQMPPPIMKPPEMRDSSLGPPRREEAPRAAGQQRVDRIGDRAGDHEGDAEQRHLREMVLAHVHELRNERAEEHQHFGVGEQHQKTLQEKPAARRGGGASALTPSTGTRISLMPSQTR